MNAPSDAADTTRGLRLLAEGISSRSGRDFFRSLVRSLAEATGVRTAFAAEREKGSRYRVIALWDGGEAPEGAEFDPAGRPCGVALRDGFVLVDRGLDARFPEASDLVGAGVQAYAAVALRDATGAPTGILGVSHDAPLDRPDFVEGAVRILATRAAAELERAATERALRASEARFRALAESSVHGVWHVAQDWATVYVNPAMARILEVDDPATLVGRDCRDFLAAESRARLEGEDGRKGYVEIEVVGARGTRRRLLVSIESKTDERGRPHGSIGIAIDLTEIRRSEEERRRLERRVEQAQRLESLGLLAGGVAHDFNNLLTGILGNADLLLMRLDIGSPLRPIVEAIEGASLRAAQLTGQMLAYSGHGRFLVEPVDLSRLVEETRALLASSVSKKARLEFRLPPGLPLVTADPGQMRQVLVSLVTNASDALGDAEGPIVVSTGGGEVREADVVEAWPKDTLAPGRYVWLEVRDGGCGMDAETQARMFDPFFTTKGTGRGMGLSAVLGIVRGHRGGVHVESRPGSGTTMRVLFPATEADAPGPRAVPAEVRSGVASRTVLVVDDEDLVRSLSRAVLEESGFRVLTANDGMEAVQTVLRHRDEVALVLLDLTMPRMGGEEAFREIRRIRADLPVVLCSGYSESEGASAIAGRDLAAFLHKPFRVSDLLKAVRGLLSS